MRPIYKKTILILLDVILFVYVIVAMVSFNKPDESKKVCSEVNIQIADESSNGFLSAGEVKKILEKNRMYPLNVNMTSVQPRMIEDLLCGRNCHMRNLPYPRFSLPHLRSRIR